MPRSALLMAPAVLALAACGGAAETAETSSVPTTSAPASATSPAPTTPTPEASTEAPDPSGTPFVDAVDGSLAAYSTLIGASVGSADLPSVLTSFDADVPLPQGSVVGAARVVEQWGDTLESIQSIGIDTAPDKQGLEDFGAAAPEGWTYNSISTTDSSSTLVMTRESDTLRVVYMASNDPGAQLPAAEFRLEAEASEIPQPAWLPSLPVPAGGEVIAVGEGVGQVEVEGFPAGSGLVTVMWRFPADQLTALQEFYAGGALEAAGFALADPDAITVGASYFDVTAGEWVGQVIVGEMMEDDDSYATVQWFLTRS